jgi:hypothetical protein
MNAAAAITIQPGNLPAGELSGGLRKSDHQGTWLLLLLNGLQKRMARSRG